MKLIKSKTLIILYLTALFLASCTMTNTKTKDPVFNDMAKTLNELTKVVTAEAINLNGKEITTNKKVTSELEINITNGQNMPTTEDERKALGKSIATLIKSNLKDKNEFDTFQILFITKVENGGVTKRNWVGNVFNSSEL